MKKTIYPVVFLVTLLGNFGIAASGPVSTGPSHPTAPSIFNESRIGLGLAGEYINAVANLKIQPQEDSTSTLDFTESNQSQVAKKIQVAPSIELGTTIAQKYYVGLLLSWHYSKAKNTSRSSIKGPNYFSNEFMLNHYADVLIKTGYKFTSRVMAYGLIGPSIAHWTHTSYQFDTFKNLVDKFKIAKSTLGLAIGLGFEYLIEKNYALSFNYTHHFHRAASKNQFMSFDDPDGPFGIATGNMNRKVQPSYGVIAIRFTKFFSL